MTATGFTAAGWQLTWDEDDPAVPVVVRPLDDLIDHPDGDCPCGPTVEPVPRPDGSFGWVETHHSLDGRELTEAP